MSEQFTLSPCGNYCMSYRKQLRVARTVGWVLFCPIDTADHVDPVVRSRVSIVSDHLGYTSLVVAFLYSLRATLPSDIFSSRLAREFDDDFAMCEALRGTDAVICAWGPLGSRDGRGRHVLGMLVERGHSPMVLDLAANGEPAHISHRHLRGGCTPIPAIELRQRRQGGNS